MLVSLGCDMVNTFEIALHPGRKSQALTVGSIGSLNHDHDSDLHRTHKLSSQLCTDFDIADKPFNTWLRLCEDGVLAFFDV